jgi:MFS family permease
VLGQRGFRRLLWIRLLGQLCDGFFQAGLAGSVLFNPQDEASPTAIAIGFAILLLPYSLVGPYLGVFLDRWSRRSIMHVSNMLRAILVVPAALLIWYGNEGLPFFGLALLIIGINRFFLASLSAATPHVVDDPRLVTANALATTLGSVIFSVGLGIAGVLVNTVLDASFHGYAVVALLAVVGYVGSALIARASFDIDALGPDAHVRRTDPILAAVRIVGRETVDGLRHLAEKRGAAYAMIAQSVHRTLYGVLALATLLLYRSVFNDSEDVTGSLSSIALAGAVGGAGLLLAAMITPPAARRIGGWRWLTALLGFVGIAVVVCGLPFDRYYILGAVFAMSFATQGVKIVVDTSVQHECADDFRGRVFSVNDTLFNVCMVIGMTIGAFTLPATGRSVTVLVAVGFGYMVLTIGYAWFGGAWARRVGDDIAQPDVAQPDRAMPLRLSS